MIAAESSQARHRSSSLWLDRFDGSLAPRPALAGDLQCDVAIVGAGFTGLWTAYHLATLQPGLRVVVIEREIAGHGAVRAKRRLGDRRPFGHPRRLRLRARRRAHRARAARDPRGDR